MAVFNASQLSALAVIQQAQQELLALRTALGGVDELHQWLASQTDSDLTSGLGFNATELGQIRSALADAHAFVQLYEAGTLPGTYSLPYVFGASQRIVIGPQ
jgi:hypothetical protein